MDAQASSTRGGRGDQTSTMTDMMTGARGLLMLLLLYTGTPNEARGQMMRPKKCPEGFSMQPSGLCTKPIPEEKPLPLPLDILEAAERGNVTAVLHFANAGADLQTTNANGQTALHLASKLGHTEVINTLLDAGARIDAADQSGQQPLHLTVPKGQFPAFKLLVKRGADPNARLYGGASLLHFAAHAGTTEAVELLVNEGADPTAVDDEKATALHAAAMSGKADIIQALALADLTDLNARDSHGTTPLHLTAQQGHVYSARKLLALGADANPKDDSAWTPFAVAVYQGYGALAVEILESLGAATAGVELAVARDDQGSTLLHLAAAQGHTDVVRTLAHRRLLHIGEDNDHRGASIINSKNDQGRTPLEVAAAAGQLQACRELLRAGANAIRSDVLTSAEPNIRARLATMLNNELDDALVSMGLDPAHAKPLLADELITTAQELRQLSYDELEEIGLRPSQDSSSKDEL
eukprot:COSAG01_NODE_1977_length_8749_cov_2.820809_4_plen_468_part_00